MVAASVLSRIGSWSTIIHTLHVDALRGSWATFSAKGFMVATATATGAAAGGEGGICIATAA